MNNYFSLGPIKIYYYSICILIGISIGIFLLFKEAKKQKIDQDKLGDLLFYTILFGILGARIYYVIFNLSYYIKNPLEIIAIWHGGLAIHGGIIAGLITIIYLTKKYKLNTLKIIDMSVPSLIIAQSIGRWGNFFNGEAYGKVVTLSHLKSQHIPNFIIDRMKIDGSYHQPTFLYESILCLIGFIILMILKNNKKLKITNLTSFYLIWYGIIRLIIEYFRTDSLMLGPIKMAMLISIVFIISGVVLLIKSKNGKRYNR